MFRPVSQGIQAPFDLLLDISLIISIDDEWVALRMNKPHGVAIDTVYDLIVFGQQPYSDAVLYKVFKDQGITHIENLLGADYT
jgi:hypothetical protein